MLESLHYQFKSDTTRTTPLAITGPKRLIDNAIASQSGPLLDDFRASEHQRVLRRLVDGQGNTTLDFDLTSTYFAGLASVRSMKVLNIIAQLDAFAKARDVSDPRINITKTPIGIAPPSRFLIPPLPESFGISFERPQGSMEELAAEIQAGMVRAANALYLYESRDHETGVMANVRDYERLEMQLGPWLGDETIIVESDPDVEPREGRIELVGHPGKTSEERLTVLLGVISALDPVEEP